MDPVNAQLADKDFVASGENRDPFAMEKQKRILDPRKPDYLVKLNRYALDEIELIAIIGGSTTRPRAMFRSPDGLGVVIKRGDRISKSHGQVTMILEDRVIVRLSHQEADEQQEGERVIQLSSASS